LGIGTSLTPATPTPVYGSPVLTLWVLSSSGAAEDAGLGMPLN
jgi:hypothetical protein